MAQVRSSHDQLQEFSLHDPLTNLYNRRRFDAVLERASFEAQQHGQLFSVLLIDLDYFKPVNDTLRLSGKAMVEDFNFSRVLVGRMAVTEVAALVERHQDLDDLLTCL